MRERKNIWKKAAIAIGISIPIILAALFVLSTEPFTNDLSNRNVATYVLITAVIIGILVFLNGKSKK